MHSTFAQLRSFVLMAFSIFSAVVGLTLHHNAGAQTVYKIARGPDVQYIVPVTNFANKGEISLSRQYADLVGAIRKFRLHVGGGNVDTAQLRAGANFSQHKSDLVEYVLWCTDGRINLNSPSNRSIRISYLANIDKCVNGRLPYRLAGLKGAGGSASFALPALTMEHAISSVRKINGLEVPLTTANEWFSATKEINEGLVLSYFELLIQERASVSSSNPEVVDDPVEVFEKGRFHIESWLRRYGRFQSRGATGDDVAKSLIGARARLMAESIQKNGEKSVDEQMTFVPFEYVYFRYGLLKILESKGYEVKEMILR